MAAAQVLGALCAVLLSSQAQAQAQAQSPANPYDYTRSSKFEYYGVGEGAKAGLLKKEWVEPDHADQCVETEYSHDAHWLRGQVLPFASPHGRSGMKRPALGGCTAS